MPFTYRENRLFCGERDLLDLARSVSGPIYVYSVQDILERARRLRSAFGRVPHAIHYAMKANGNAEILRRLAREGLGADTVSAGEIEDALAAGFAPNSIVFSGVGKTRHEIEFAVRLGIKQINIESPQELERVAQVAMHLEKPIDVAFRMNPDVNPQTHPYITTGFRENKFGMDESFLPELLRILQRDGARVRLRGLTLHIGSQLTELASLEEAITKTLPVFHDLRGRGFPLDRFDIGGGLGIHYGSDDTSAEFQLMSEYGQLVHRLLGATLPTSGRMNDGSLGCEIMCEPGRMLVARSGLLIGQVQYIKSTPQKTFVILDTGMHHLLRPALYQAQHRVLPLETRVDSITKPYDIVGPICESSDVLAKNVVLPEIRQGDYVAIADAGAYGYSMASFYNRHALPTEIVLD
ncbi:MAG: diaminopimelate decarboxylase [Bdellovibrionaceae bacterium]|nr:diaminopimelate decarboxylase [Pseudobdellovibrionaceae bacterium]